MFSSSEMHFRNYFYKIYIICIFQGTLFSIHFDEIYFFLSICRPVDTPQSYSKGPQQTQTGSRSAASPLSPPRQGATTNYPPFSGVPAREAPIRYVQQSPYGVQVNFI